MIHHRTVHYEPFRGTGDASFRPSWRAFVPGGALVTLGLAILIVPQLLVALVASLFLVAGTVALMAAWRLRKMAEEAARERARVEVDPWFGTPVEELLVRFSWH